jgi:LysM repeat protein
MLRIVLAILCISSGSLLARAASGDDSAGSGNDVRELRELIEQQSKQIDVLAQEIARLNLLLEAKNPALSPIPDTSATEETAAPAGTKIATRKAEPVAEAASADASAAPSGTVHVVTKGETLTAIAKRYKVTVPDILKVNKITDARKLQIGQTLFLPSGAKIQDSPTPQPPKP